MTAPQRNPPAVAGRNFIANIDRLRRARSLSYQVLAAELTEAGHPINPVSLSRLGRGERRAGVDDLIAFAGVFGVAPMRLLAPPGAAGAEEHPAVRAAGTLADCLAVLAAAGPETASRARAQADRALRRVQIEVEELLDSTPGTLNTRTDTEPAACQPERTGT